MEINASSIQLKSKKGTKEKGSNIVIKERRNKSKYAEKQRSKVEKRNTSAKRKEKSKATTAKRN